MKKYSLFLLLSLSVFHSNSFAAHLTIESPAFKKNSMIPAQYTCDGKDESPPLTWRNIPKNTQSLTLIIEDPDAPDEAWNHWILFNIAPTMNKLDAGSPVPPGAANAKNSWGGLDYRGPCPSIGAHSYHFKLYALDKELTLGDNTTRDLVQNAMTGHVIASAELVGLYQRFKN
ncbi:MAG: YbhB/YbcL family Raf kinase inhibitor-like protein [Legionella longbeachae]|nr:YbhB/YbcL family Raf kinase inhibitor-like protein [Legionella longbeachae]